MLLAAGSSSRFGSDKRAHVLPDGRSLLTATVAKYVGAFAELIVVLRPGEEALAEELRRRFDPATVTIVHAQDAHLGMGHSIAAGIREAKGWDFAFVALGDMPFVHLGTLATLNRVDVLQHPGIVYLEPDETAGGRLQHAACLLYTSPSPRDS